ncbi:MAG: HlyD family efflux transporter periplasmic adaptor subunit [Treponema sp.]|jgi:hypothetical protein|nr:HlyD family efflux transporter periplasmic adaptor subunit [Treponema sp.]
MDDNNKNVSSLTAQLDKMVSVIEIKSWIAFGTILIILSAALIWGFLGTMRQQKEASGVIVRSGRIFHIYATDDTILLDFPLTPNQYIERDQIVARIEQLGLVREINLMLNTNAPKLELEAKREELIARSQIRAHSPGRVVEVYARTGDYVKRGDRLVTIAREPLGSRALECLLFVPINQAKYMRRGMQVNIFPASVSRRNYGNMTGSIMSISEFPITFQYISDRLGSEELAQEFLKHGAVHEINVLLEVSEETPTGYRWTTSMGPNQRFGNLTLCDASVVLEELRPINVFFPGIN